jgi:hypothetical protein
MNSLMKSVNLNLKNLNKLKLPNEWIQMFRILLSIYLVWIILLAVKKPVFNDNLITRMIFIILLVLLSQTDIISGILLLLIYFFSFQAILPMINNNLNETFEEQTQEKEKSNRKIDKIMGENLQKGYEIPKETDTPPLKADLGGLLAFNNSIKKKL